MWKLRRVLIALLASATVFFYSVIFYWTQDHAPRQPAKPELTYESPEDFENFDNVSGTPDGRYIVPNYVHFVRLGQPNFKFVDAVCVLAALKNQKPEKLFIHTDVAAFQGKYWNVLVNDERFRSVATVKYVERPLGVYGQAFNKRWKNFHSGDIVRLNVLMEYGGIFLDNDSYIVKSLNDLRRYEMTIGWREGGNLANQVIIAHKNARFLRLWMSTYRVYNASSWFYNAGIKPTQEVLVKNPGLIHRMKRLLAAHGRTIIENLYLRNWPGWKSHYAIHLLIRHPYMLKNENSSRPKEFDEDNIKNFNATFRDMVYDVYPINYNSSISP